ncbi:O-antigen ligase family protein [Fictibacillus barbaricus]|uniref:O-antigen ligase family protein n=1 Tax=Fictibacillus barbaricus TaxID=182136 RepID=A0ABS2ZGI1_9BACL|nr:O-antigen ligase family protein [Fictibacillus barbaricus]MBN3546531.1 O-antigen ligase family protein [Fictibacillus barbaricus]GGB41758.1 hypothetical protein GCM10007199_03790 [Fictibacillus barbaricus]
MENLFRNIHIKKEVYLSFLAAVALGILVLYLGKYTLGIILAPIGLYFIIKIKPSPNTALVIIGLLLYVNILKPLGMYQIVSSLVDLLVLTVILKYCVTVGIKNEQFKWIIIASGFLFVSFFEIFNPNIPSFEAGLQGFRKTSFAFMLFYIGIFKFKEARKVKEFLIKFSILTLPLLLYGIKQSIFISEIDRLYLFVNSADTWTGTLFGETRATSVFSGPFHFGMFSAILAVINLFLMEVVNKKRYQLIFLLFFFVSFLACNSSLTRTNLVALVGAIIAYKLIQMKIKSILILLPIITGSLIAVYYLIVSNTYFLLSSNNQILRMIGTISNIDNDSRFEGRSQGWESILNLVAKNPLLAYGTGSSGDTLNTVYDFQYHVTSHNVFLKILMETGVIGLAMFASLFIGISLLFLKKVLNKETTLIKKVYACCFAVMVVFFINGLVGSALDTYPISSIVLLFMGIGVTNLTNEENITNRLDSRLEGL